jgi:hypothetical protein
MATTRGSKRRRKSMSIRLPPPMDNGVTIADLLRRLGNIPASRVRLYPTPGTATELSKSNTKGEMNRKLTSWQPGASPSGADRDLKSG